MEQSRFKSWVTWAAIIAQVISILLVLSVINEEQADAIKSLPGLTPKKDEKA